MGNKLIGVPLASFFGSQFWKSCGGFGWLSMMWSCLLCLSAFLSHEVRLCVCMDKCIVHVCTCKMLFQIIFMEVILMYHCKRSIVTTENGGWQIFWGVPNGNDTPKWTKVSLVFITVFNSSVSSVMKIPR